jgi:hypothetical protein
MSSIKLPSVIEINGVKELVRNSDFGQPWPLEKISVGFDAAKLTLPESLMHLRESWLLRNANERIDSKIAIRLVDQDSDHKLHFKLQATSWDQVRPLHEAYSSLSVEIKTLIASGKICTPNIGVVHVVACTTDGWIAMFCRGKTAHYYPGRQSVTYEEGLAPEDAMDNDFFRRAARRGLAEEVAEELRTLPLDCFKVMSVVLEREFNNPAVIVLANLPFSKEQMPFKHQSDELSSDSLQFLPISISAISNAIASSNTPTSGLWHPSSKFRLLLVLANYFGENAAATAIASQ